MKLNIKSMLDDGMSPRAVHNLVQEQHTQEVVAKVASGEYSCPRCGGALRLVCNEEGHAIAFACKVECAT